MNRTKGILAAGTLTGLVVITLLALGFGNLGASGGQGETNTAVSEPAPVIIEQQQPVDNSADEAAVQAWQEYTTQLENTVQTMQSRENEYQAQLDAANQTIINLQDQMNTANAAAGAPTHYDDDDHGEHEDHDDDHGEHEEHDDDDD